MSWRRRAPGWPRSSPSLPPGAHATRRPSAPRWRSPRRGVGQRRGAEPPRPEALRHPDRRTVGVVDRVDDLRPAEGVDRPVDRRGGGLPGVAPPPARPQDPPADLRAGPPERLQRTDPAHPVAGLPFDHREHAEALDLPAADGADERAPDDRLGLHAPEVGHRLLVAHELGPPREVLAPRGAQHQPRGLERRTVHGGTLHRGRVVDSPP